MIDHRIIWANSQDHTDLTWIAFKLENEGYHQASATIKKLADRWVHSPSNAFQTIYNGMREGRDRDDWMTDTADDILDSLKYPRGFSCRNCGNDLNGLTTVESHIPYNGCLRCGHPCDV